MTVEELIQDVRIGKRPAYAWGLGYTYKAFHAIHGLPIEKIVHSAQQFIGKKIDGIPVCAPEELNDLAARGGVVIGYTTEYRRQIIDFCSRIPGLGLVFYDNPALLGVQRVQDLAANLRSAVEFGLLKGEDRDMLVEALSKSQIVMNLDRANCREILAAGYDFSYQFRKDVHHALTRQIQLILHRGSPGDFAEFGTFSGTTSEFIAAAIADAQTQSWALNGGAPGNLARKLHLFDSFEGLPEITHQVDVEAEIWKKGMFRGMTAEELRQHISNYLPADDIKIYSGWYKDTLPSIPAGQKYALVHIDCDLYESTIDVLDYLIANHHLSDGCAIFFDDWNCSAASPAFGERRAWNEVVEKYQLRFSDCGDYSIYGHKFLVHLT